MNIVLIGYRCTGKSSVGRLLSKEIGWEYIDTDELIQQKSGFCIDDIVRQYGWNRFRELEKEIVKEVSNLDNYIISTGGGVVLNEENVYKLKERGFFIWLKADSTTIRARMKEDQKTDINRPALTDANPIDEIEHVLKLREPLYDKYADFIVNTDNLSEQQVCNIILKKILRFV